MYLANRLILLENTEAKKQLTCTRWTSSLWWHEVVTNCYKKQTHLFQVLILQQILNVVWCTSSCVILNLFTQA